ncbi:MAG: class C beta-lactamase-related serine hydrolase [Alphaproteobacteria bacterium]|nr:MAG: class C beta-lactamase-related serine hydrolase [Alphaproteobacteria bacterium]
MRGTVAAALCLLVSYGTGAAAGGRPSDLGDGIHVVTGATELGPEFDARMAALTGAIEAGKFKEVHSLLVYKEGALRYENYFPGNSDWIDFPNGIKRMAGAPVGWDADRKHYMASVTKTVTAILTGIALDQLHADVETPVRDFLPPDLQSKMQPDAEKLTFDQALGMQAGFVWDEWTGDDLVRLWQSGNFAETLFSHENRGPGSFWVYNSAVPNLVLTAIEHRLGEPLKPWADRNFFGALGITDCDWPAQPTGTPEGSARLHLRPRDMLKIGILLLDHGRWQGRQVVPANWVATMTRVHARPDAGDYGYFTWLRDVAGLKYFSADGDGGQQINVFPDQGLVVVMTQGNYGEWPLYQDQARAMMADYILPATGLH